MRNTTKTVTDNTAGGVCWYHLNGRAYCGRCGWQGTKRGIHSHLRACVKRWAAWVAWVER